MLRSVYEQINVQIRGLAAIFVNTDYYVRLSIPVIMSKLPSDMKLRKLERAQVRCGNRRINGGY